LSGVLFDIDFFKQVNDLHGHLSGDTVLQSVAHVAKSLLRDNDTVARWGGEEFIVLLKDCSLEQAAGVAEKLRFAIARHDFPAVPDRQITISLGVAEYALGESCGDFFIRADQALYKAKGNGRNRLQVALQPDPVVKPLQLQP
jgi:diguanylate cyclase (GGDEF)-like protein